VTTTNGDCFEERRHLLENSEDFGERQIEDSDAENWILRLGVSGAA
jgi:hypothetical protein